jgi:general secretion pathway protein E
LKDALENVVGGVVLVLVPPTHGLTTLGYALLTEHNAYTSDIKTIERQVDRRLEGVTQLAWIAGEATNEYSTALQSIVRRGPNVMLVSDITDAGTGPILTHANSQNTLFYVLIPTDSVTIGLSTYLKAVGDPKSAANSLRAVVAGRLVRKLCPECRQSFQASPDQSKRLGAAAGKPLQLFRASGKVQIKNDIVDCGNCQGTGFLGTVGVFEVVRPDERGREMLIAGDIPNAYQQMRRAFRTPLTQECALLKVRAGETSLEEIARVFAPKVPPPAKPSGAAATPAANPAGAPTTTPKTLKKEAK